MLFAVFGLGLIELIIIGVLGGGAIGVAIYLMMGSGKDDQ